jgi:hypothetical protein
MNPFQKIVSNHLVFLLTLGIALVLTGCNSQRGTLDDATLEAKALAEAINYGLIGDPLATKSVRMNLEEWSQLVGGGYGEGAEELGLTPDLPVFVFVIRGEIVWKGPSGQAWWGGEAERSDNITIVLNAKTGQPIYHGSARVDSSMPVPIP